LTDGPAHEATIFPTKVLSSKNAGDDTIPQYLLATIVNRTSIEVYDLQGAKMLSILVGQGIQKLITNTANDEMFVACFTDDLKLNFYTITMTQVLIPEPEESEQNSTKSKKKQNRRYKTEYSSKLEFSASISDNFDASQLKNDASWSPLDPNYYTSFISFTTRAQKYIIIGTAGGELIFYLRNGTFGAKSRVGNSPIISIQRMYPNILYATKDKLGLFNPQTLENDRYLCDSAGDEIIDAVADLYGNPLFYALIKTGEILAYELKPNSKNCKIASKRNSILGAPNNNITFGRLHHVKNYVLYQTSHDQLLLLAFNVTDPTTPDFEAISGVKMNLGTLGEEFTDISVSTFKSGPISSLIVSVGENLDGSSRITIHEFTVPRAAVDDWFANYRIPFLVLSCLLVFGYQFWYKKKKSDKDDQDKEFNRYERTGKSRTGGNTTTTSSSSNRAGGLGTTTGVTRRTDLASGISEQTRSLEEKLSAMDRRLESLGSNFGISKNKYDDDGDDVQEISYKKHH